MAREWSTVAAELGLDEEELHRGPSPGKSTLTSRLADVVPVSVLAQQAAVLSGRGTSIPNSRTPSAPVQRATKSAGTDPRAGFVQSMGLDFDATSNLPPEQVRSDAARGVSGGGGALPHQQIIQASFGKFDVSGIRAHVGGAAAEASNAIGARAYATGSDVAFAEAPDLHTTAHEAAHVIQQQAGVHLAGGVGRAGDPYEQHADAVADAVVAGRSAEPILAQMAPTEQLSIGSSDQTQRLVVQRDGDDPVVALRAQLGRARYAERQAIVEEWAGRATAEQRRQALADERIQVHMGRSGAARAAMVQVLSTGQTHSADPVSRLRQALAASDNGGFRAAWDEVARSPALLAQVSRDASFQQSVRGRMSTDIQEMVRITLQGGAVEATESYGLTPSERRRVRSLADNAVGALSSEFSSLVYVDDGVIELRLARYFADVRTLVRSSPENRGSGEERQWQAKREDARRILCDLFEERHHSPITREVQDHVQDRAKRRHCMRMLGAVGLADRVVQGDGAITEATAAAPAANQAEGTTDASPETGAATPTSARSSNRFSPEDITSLETKAREVLDGLHAELEREWYDVGGPNTTTVRSLLQAYERRAVQRVDRVEDRPAATRTTLLTRARRLLDGRYNGRAGRHLPAATSAAGLRWTVAGGLGGTTTPAPRAAAEAEAPEVQAPEAESPEASSEAGPVGREQVTLSEEARTRGQMTTAQADTLTSVCDRRAEAMHAAFDLNDGQLILMAARTTRTEVTEAVGQDEDHGGRGRARRGLEAFQHAYDERYGSLATGVRNAFVNDAAEQQRIREILGLAADLVDTGAADTGNDNSEARARISEWREWIHDVATNIAQKVDAEDQAGLVTVCRTYARNRDAEWNDLLLMNDFERSSYRANLEQAYLPHGSLQEDIRNTLTGSQEGTALRAIGYAASEEGDATEAQGDELQQALTPSIENLSGQLVQARAVRERPWPMGVPPDTQGRTEEVRAILAPMSDGNAFGALHECAISNGIGAAEAGARVATTWLAVTHRPVHHQLERAIAGDEELEPLGTALMGQLHLPWRGSAAEAEAGDARLADVVFDESAVGAGFTVQTAIGRANQWHELLTDSARLNRVLTRHHNREENRVVGEVYRRLFHETFGTALHRCQPADATRLLNTAETSGAATLLERITGYIEANSSSGVIDAVFEADPSERQGLLQDHADVISRIRTELGARTHQTVMRACTGELSLADMLRRNDADEGPMGGALGSPSRGIAARPGTDEDGMSEDIDRYCRLVRSRVSAEHPNWTGEQVTAEVRSRVQREYGEAETQSVLGDELEGADRTRVDAHILTAGEVGHDDEAAIAIDEDADDSVILGHLRGMTDAERGRRRNDPAFSARISRIQNRHTREEAFNLLYSDRDASHEAAVLAGAYDEDGTDADAVFRNLNQMNEAEQAAFVADDEQVQRIRLRLRGDDRQRYDSVIERMRANVEGGATDPDHDGLLDVASRDRRKTELVERHLSQLNRALAETDDTRTLMTCAQDVYRESEVVRGRTRSPQAAECEEGQIEEIELFTAVERQLVRDGLENLSEWEQDIQSVVTGAVMHTRDPATHRLEAAIERGGFAGMGDADTAGAQEAIRSASDRTICNTWSNVLKPGVESPRAMKPLYDAWVATGIPDVMNPPMGGAAWEAFHEFELNVALDVDRRVRHSAATDAEAQELVDAIQARILGLSSAVLGRALGTDPNDTYLMGLLTNRDREARSRVAHTRDDHRHVRGQRSLTDNILDETDQVDEAQAQAEGSITAAEADDHWISGREAEASDRRCAEFGIAVDDLQAARQKVADATKTVTSILIGAIATALTGPAGMGLMASFMTSVGTSVVSVAIDEAILANDFEATREGLQRVLVDAATSAITANVTQWLPAASRAPVVGNLIDRFRRFQAYDDFLTARVRQTWAQQAGAILSHATRSTAEQYLRELPHDVADAAVSALFSSEWRYGGDDALAHAAGTVDDNIPELGLEVLERLLGHAITHTARAGIERLRGQGPAPTNVEGATEATPGSPRTNGSPVTEAVRHSLSGTELTNAATAQAGSTIAGVVVQDDEVDGWQQLGTFARGRATAATRRAAGNVRNNRNAPEIRRRLDAFESQTGHLPDAERARWREAYLSHLQGTRGGEIQSPADFRAQIVNPAYLAMERETQGMSEADAAAYRTWVLQDPGNAERRTRRMSGERYMAQRERASERAEEIRRSPGYRTGLTATQRDYYDAYLENPDRLMAFSSGGTASARRGAFDVSDAASRARFVTACAGAQRRIAAERVRALVDGARGEALASQIESSAVTPPDVFRQGDDRNDALVRTWVSQQPASAE